MWPRRSKNRAVEVSDNNSRSQLSESAGGLAVGGNAEVPTIIPETRPYHVEIRDRILTMQATQKEFLRQAIQRGVAVEDLSTVVADAMNAGQFPRVLQSNNGPSSRLSFRGSGARLQLLGGIVPAEALNAHATIVPADEEHDEHLDYHVHLSGAYDAGEFNDSTTFIVESTGLLPQVEKGIPVDMAMLAKIDAHLYPPALH